MLFATVFAAAVNVNSQEYKNGVLLGSLIAGVVCGLWPLCTGLSRERPVMGVIGFFACIPCGFLAGCLLALPAAFILKTVIGALPRPESQPLAEDDFRDPPFNPYSNGNRSAF